jgi:hypothetical protein
MSFYEKGPVRIGYEEAGSGFPLLLIPGGGLNSTISALTNPFNPIEEFKGEYRCTRRTCATQGEWAPHCTCRDHNLRPSN